MVSNILTRTVLFCINYLFAHMNGFKYENIKYSFICTQLNSIKSYYITLTIQFRYTVNEFQILLINTNNSIQHYSFVCTIKFFKVLICITNNSIKHQIFVYAQFNGQQVHFFTIPFNLSYLFAHILNVQHFLLIH